MISPIISCKNLSKHYVLGDSVTEILKGISLDVYPGEFVALMGPSGSGKSTLMNLLGLLDTPSSGDYVLNGQSVIGMNEDEAADYRSQVIGFIFQQFNLIPRTTAIDNVSLPLLYAQHGVSKASSPAQLLESVGLDHRKHHKPNELSGGQQQRVAIARALVNAPKLIFADEPTGNLDSKSQEDIMKLLKALHDTGITIVMVTHEEEVARYASRIIRLKDGEIQSDTGSNMVLDSSDRILQYQSSMSFSKRKSFFQQLSAHFSQSYRSLIANKVRTFLSMLGILIGVAAVITMMALGKGASIAIEKQLSSLGTNLLVVMPGSNRSRGVSLEAGAVTRFTISDMSDIQGSVENIRRVSGVVSGTGRIQYGNRNKSTRLQGVSYEYAAMRSSQPQIGRFFTHDEDKSRAKVAVIGVSVLRELFMDDNGKLLKNPIGEFLWINRVKFQIIGVLPEKGASSFRDQDDIVMIPLNTAMKRVLGKDFLDSIEMEVNSAQNMSAVESDVSNLIIKKHRLNQELQESFQIRNLSEIQETLSETSKTMSVLLASIAAISLFVGGIGIMNIMLVSVTERTREIGLRKAVGAKKFDILSQFLIESLVISFLGGILGVVLGVVSSLLLSQVAGWTIAFNFSAILFSFLFSALIGVVFGLWPAKKAANLNSIDALRYE